MHQYYYFLFIFYIISKREKTTKQFIHTEGCDVRRQVGCSCVVHIT